MFTSWFSLQAPVLLLGTNILHPLCIILDPYPQMELSVQNNTFFFFLFLPWLFSELGYCKLCETLSIPSNLKKKKKSAFVLKMYKPFLFCHSFFLKIFLFICVNILLLCMYTLTACVPHARRYQIP